MSLGASMDVRFGTSVAEFVDYVTDLGLDHVELTAEYLHGHPDTPGPERIGELADSYDVTLTYHAPFRDWNLGSFNDRSAEAGAAQVKETLDAAATAGAGAVVVHGGDVPERYPDWVRAGARENAIESLTECAEHAADVGVPLCLENQPVQGTRERHTTSPDALAETLDATGVGPDALQITLDIGHATVNDNDWRTYVDRFGDRITVCHLHRNDGTADQHEPLADYEDVVETVDAEYSVFEMKSLADIAQCVGAEPERVPQTSP